MPKAIKPMFTFIYASKRGAFYAPDLVVWGGMGFQFSAIRDQAMKAAINSAQLASAN